MIVLFSFLYIPKLCDAKYALTLGGKPQRLMASHLVRWLKVRDFYTWQSYLFVTILTTWLIPVRACWSSRTIANNLRTSSRTIRFLVWVARSCPTLFLVLFDLLNFELNEPGLLCIIGKFVYRNHSKVKNKTYNQKWRKYRTVEKNPREYSLHWREDKSSFIPMTTRRGFAVARGSINRIQYGKCCTSTYLVTFIIIVVGCSYVTEIGKPLINSMQKRGLGKT